MVKILQREINKKLKDCLFSIRNDTTMNVVANIGNSDYSIRRALETIQLGLQLDKDDCLKEAIQLLVLARAQCEVENSKVEKAPRKLSKMLL